MFDRIRFGKLHHDLRYSSFSERSGAYAMLRVEEADARGVVEKLQRRKGFLQAVDRLRR